MHAVFPFLDSTTFLAALGIAICAGIVKGVVGFAMPLILISGLTLFLEPEVALAGLIAPTLVTNTLQSLRQGVGAAWETVRNFRVFLIAGGVALVTAAQFVRIVPESVLLFAIGGPAVGYAALQLSGWAFSLKRRSVVVEVLFGAITGMLGGLTGVWAASTVIYLTALSTAKADQIRIQGVIYGAGSFALVGAHLGSGVLSAQTIPFSVMLVVPAVSGMWIGRRISDRIDQAMFKQATLIVLLIAGANLIRRSLF